MASRLNRMIVFSAGLGSSFLAVRTLDNFISSPDGDAHHRHHDWPSLLKLTPLETLDAKMSTLKPYLNDGERMKLQQVQVITRHGARTPFKFIPNIEPATWREEDNIDLPHTMIDFHVRTADGGGQPESAIDNAYLKKDRLKGGSLVGQLTQVGQQEMYDLGKRLKSKYIHELGFLSPEFHHEEVYVRTTNILRTIKSARCILAGMYGETTLKSPITMITSVNEHEFMYPNYYFCKSLKHWAEIAWATAAEVPGLTEFCAAAGKRLGMKENADELSIIALIDNMRAREAHGHPVPNFLLDQNDDIEKLAVMVQLRVIGGTGKSVNIIRNSVGNFLENICTQMEDKIHNQSQYKMLLYSAHDTTVMALLKVFGVYDYKWPKFAADLKIELYKQSADKWFVKVLYNDKEMRLPGCDSTLCPAERFLKMMENYRVKDWDADCGVKGDYKKETFAIGTI